MKKQIITIFPLVLIILILTLWTLQRNHVYRSEISLWEDNFLKSPNKTRVCINLAYSYKKIGEDELGIAALIRAFTIDPDLMPYFAALKYAHDRGYVLKTEKSMWEKRRD